MSSWGLDFVINHAFHKHLVSNYYMPGTVLEAGDAAKNKTGGKSLLRWTINKYKFTCQVL